MAGLKLHHIYKVYQNGVKAVNDFNIDINDGEFIVFVGPSGCGKSTTLRMIAGLEEITSGELFIGDTLVNNLEPKDRDIAFVFQNYALYPHMTVYDNMAYGLKNRKVSKKEINEKVLAAAKMLDIEQYLSRLPKELSGGQRQRVALGRALVRSPKVFLLDEPLSNLDAKLRSQMRSEISKIHKKVKTTFIYVTHDQVEAMTMGTRIVVMKDGFIQQIASPLDLYNKPANKFVAGFIGTPPMNFYDLTINKYEDKLLLSLDEANHLQVPYSAVSKIDHTYLGKKVTIGIRPEHVIVGEDGLVCNVTLIEQLGTESIIYGDITLADKTVSVVAKIPFDSPIKENDIVKVKFDCNFLHFFDVETGNSILDLIPQSYHVTATVESKKMTLLGQKIKLPPCLELEDGDYELIIPSDAICEGKDLKFDVLNTEEINDKLLAKISVDSRDYYFLVNENSKKLKGSLLFDKVTILKNNEVVHNPVNSNLVLDGYICKEGNNYYFNIEENHVEPSMEKIQKVALVDGMNCHKIKYSFVTDLNEVTISETGIKATIIREVDYNVNTYYEVEINGKHFLINKTKELETTEIFLQLNFDNSTIINTESNIIVA